ncbi:hypothetical protein B7992_08275 [Fibrobacter sp. UWH1]|nr:hypothetical protein B7992_08275 [Fibrobacter sp. UWH1]
MTDKYLIPNFKLSEFTKSSVTDYQLSLLQLLAKNLQKVRDLLQPYAVSGKRCQFRLPVEFGLPRIIIVL